MAVTFFANGLVVSDEAAARADAFCEAVMLHPYMDAHDGEPPVGWPSNLARKELIEWSIKLLFARRVRAWEHQIAIGEVVEPPPWEGGMEAGL